MSQIVAIPRETFLARWHDRAGDGTLYEQYGIVLWKPTEASDLSEMEKDDRGRCHDEKGYLTSCAGGGGGAPAAPTRTLKHAEDDLLRAWGAHQKNPTPDNLKAMNAAKAEVLAKRQAKADPEKPKALPQKADKAAEPDKASAGGAEQQAALHKKTTEHVSKLVSEIGAKPEVINAGGCFSFASKLAGRVEGAKALSNGIHGYTEAGGKYYDAEVPQGVAHPKDLPFFKRAPGLWNEKTFPVESLPVKQPSVDPAATAAKAKDLVKKKVKSS